MRAATPIEAVLLLQRTHGNRAVARQLARSPKIADPKAPPGHKPWAEQTTYSNVALAQEVDTYEALSPQALADVKDQMIVQASRVGDPRHNEFERKLRALEFLASQGKVQQRRYTPPPGVDVETDTRRWVRQSLEGYVRREGSFKEAVLDFQNWAFNRLDPDADPAGRDFDNWMSRLDVIEKDVDAFGEEFKHQARDVALKMLHDSQVEILSVLKSYGLASDWALFHANRIANDKDVDDEINTLVHFSDAWDQPDKRNPTYSPRRHRAGLGRLITELKEQQETVKAARFRSYNDPVGMATTEKLIDARHRLTRLWSYVEAQHPVLAAYRGSGELADADLGRLDDDLRGSEPQMTSMLKTILPKLADIMKVSWQIDHNRVNPLSLPPVVALTKAVMFVPDGSLRWGKVNDLVEEAQKKSISKKILEGLLALIVLATLIPSGGTSLGIGIGIVSAALSASSAMEDWQDYKQQKTLANTAMDRAKALSLEEPSLLPFAFDLISLGIDGAPLLKAFHEAVKLKSLVLAGEDAASKEAIAQIREELNNLGNSKGRPHLGDQAVDDARTSVREGTEHEKPGPGKSEGQGTATAEEKSPGKAGKKQKARARVPLTKQAEEMLKKYSSRADVVKAIEKRLAVAGTARPIGWERAFEALRANPSRINRKIIEQLDRVMSALQGPKLYAEVLGDAWQIVKWGQAEDINAALKALAEASGLKVAEVDAIKSGGAFFRDVVSKREYWLDPALGGQDHGEFTHLLQDLVVDRALGGPGKSAEFRSELLAKATGTIERYEKGGGKMPSRWLLDDDGNLLNNSLFVDTKNTSGQVISEETKMTTGDYVWRWTYDLFYRNFNAYGRLPQPEVIRPTLNELFLGLK